MKNNVEKIFVVFIWFTHLYYAFRYPFKYGNPRTSGTYGPTPFYLKVAKYVIVLLILLLLLCILLYISRKFLLSKNQKFALLLISSFSVYVSVFGFFNTEPTGLYTYAVFIEAIFFMPLIVIFSLFYRGNINKYSKLIFYCTIYHSVYTFIQILMYVLYSRLPNIAYANFVRFGGGWDTPNAFGMFMVLPFLISLASIKHEKTYLNIYVFCSSLLLVFMTLSLTAISVFFGAFGLFLLITRRWRAVGALSLSLTSICLLVIFTPSIYSLFEFVMEMKAGSIKAHQESLDISRYISDHSVLEMFAGDMTGNKFSESSYVYILSNFGIVGLLNLVFLILFTSIYGIYKSYKTYGASKEVSDLISAYTTYVIAFSIGSINLPFFSIFPVNVYFWLSIVFIFFTPYRSR